jgi:Domain of unknown function (DUF222)/HNH endonuclease
MVEHTFDTGGQVVATLDPDQFEAPMFNLGEWLTDRRAAINGAEAAWLDVLAEFDDHRDWAADGAVSAVEWLGEHCRMARSTAFEKVSLAHELRRRPKLAGALASGRISYCAVRTICRAHDADDEVEASLINLAATEPLWKLLQAVAYRRRLCQQDHPPPTERRGLRCRRGYDGEAGEALVCLPADEFEEFESAVDAFVGPVDESTRADSWMSRRADALMEIVRTALAHRHEPAMVEGHTVHVVSDLRHRAELADGAPLHLSTAERLGCDAWAVLHLRHGTELLALGRRTRIWSTAQRRAIGVRDQGRCRFPGCERRLTQVHHVVHWRRGGPTDVSNGALFCTGGHHKALHEGGFECRGDANGELTFSRPDGTVLGTSRPPTPVSELGLEPSSRGTGASTAR